jgi:hypothetical protein
MDQCHCWRQGEARLGGIQFGHWMVMTRISRRPRALLQPGWFRRPYQTTCVNEVALGERAGRKLERCSTTEVAGFSTTPSLSMSATLKLDPREHTLSVNKCGIEETRRSIEVRQRRIGCNPAIELDGAFLCSNCRNGSEQGQECFGGHRE